MKNHIKYQNLQVVSEKNWKSVCLPPRAAFGESHKKMVSDALGTYRAAKGEIKRAPRAAKSRQVSPKSRQEAPRAGAEAPTRDPGGPKTPKPIFKTAVVARIREKSVWAAKSHPRGQRSIQDSPKEAQEPREPQGRPKRGPRAAKSSSKRRQERPRTPKIDRTSPKLGCCYTRYVFLLL